MNKKEVETADRKLYEVKFHFVNNDRHELDRVRCLPGEEKEALNKQLMYYEDIRDVVITSVIEVEPPGLDEFDF